MRPEKIQISLPIRAKSNSFLSAFCIAKYAKFPHTDNEDSDQTSQADLSLRWVHISEGTFSNVATQIIQN